MLYPPELHAPARVFEHHSGGLGARQTVEVVWARRVTDSAEELCVQGLSRFENSRCRAAARLTTPSTPIGAGIRELRHNSSPGRGGIVWPTAKAVGVRGAE